MKEQKKTAKKTVELLQSVSETEQAKVNGGTGEINIKKTNLFGGGGGVWLNNHNETLLKTEAIA